MSNHFLKMQAIPVSKAIFLFTLMGCACFLGTTASAAEGGVVTVGSKNFAENRLLAEMFAQLIEARTGLTVRRKLNMAGTAICFEALRSGDIDLYPEYTGTGLAAILKESPEGVNTLRRVRAEFLKRWDLWWLSPLGFENAYELAAPEALAARENLRTISDLARIAPTLDAGFGYEFLERGDGFPGLREAYGLEFKSTRGFQQALKYQAAAAGEIAALDVYTTDGRLLAAKLRVLEDDRGFFPPYAAAALVRGETLRRFPEIGPVLALLAGSLDEDAMRRLNYRLQELGEPTERVAAEALAELGLTAPPAVDGGNAGRGESVWAFMTRERTMIANRAWEHLWLSAAAIALGALFAVPIGVALERSRKRAEAAIAVLGAIQTIPSLALLAFMIPVLGVGVKPAIAALWLYSLFPMARNALEGVRDADPNACEAALALGMTPSQILWRIRLPLAAPIIMAGVRTAAVITVGTATLAAFIGAGGLGRPIVAGLQLADARLILAGAIPAALLALLVDGGLYLVSRALRPAGR